jgi:hypothetical protein
MKEMSVYYDRYKKSKSKKSKAIPTTDLGGL